MPRGNRVQLSLFPFMSVLACTIGALTLLLLSLSLTSVGAPGLSRETAPETSSDVRPEPPDGITSGSKPLEDRRDAIERAEATWAALDRALEARGLPAGSDLERLRGALEDVERRERSLETLEQIEARMAEIRRTQESVETSIEVLESRRQTLPILIDPTGLSRDQKPFFMECDGGGLTAHRATDDLEYFIPLDAVGSHGDFNRYLRRIRATPGALLVLLVRPGGVEAMDRAAELARAAGVRVARMPLPGDGELDWRLLREAEAARPVGGAG